MSAKGIPQIAVVTWAPAPPRHLRAGDERRDGDRPRNRDDLPGRPAAREGRDRQGGERRGARRRRRPLARLRGDRRRAVSDEHLLAHLARQIVRTLHRRKPEPPWDVLPPEEPLYDPEKLYGIVPTDYGKGYDVRELIARLVDGPPPRVQGALRRDARLRLRPHRGLPGCDSREQWRALLRIRVEARISSSSPSGACRSSSSRTSRASWSGRSTSRAASPRTAPSSTAVACAQVPKLTVIVGGSFGAETTACAAVRTPRQLWMWPNARISVMGGEQAATVPRPSGAPIPTRSCKYEREGSRTTRPPASGTTGSSTRGHPQGDRAGHLGGAQRADPGHVRRLPDVAAVAVRPPARPGQRRVMRKFRGAGDS